MKTTKLKIFLGVMLTLSVISCEKYLDVNTDPNNLAKDKITPALLMPGAMNGAHRVQSVAMNNLGNIWMQNWGGDVENFTAANIEEYSLQITNNFIPNIWDNIYLNVSNFQAIIDFPSTTNDNHKAVAMIMKSYYMQYIVDLHGNAPYSQAFKGQDNLNPKYDKDVDIYRDLIVTIDKAIETFYAADVDDETLGNSDVMLGGNVTSWLRFANTVKMKILLRQATLAETDAATATYITTEFNKIIASGAGFSTSNVTINPGYSSATNLNQNPLYGTFFNNASATGTATQFNNFTRATDFISQFMNGTSPATSAPPLVDPRRNRLYSGSGNISGAVQGSVTGPAVMSKVGPGVLVGHTQPGFVTSLAEVRFMIAEAKVRGYLPGGVGAALIDFNAGVAASFTQLGAGSAVAYLSSANTKADIGWGASTNKIHAIMTQKWLATNGTNAMESYIENVRTGFPIIPLATTALFPNRPLRLLYPTSELVSNSANVPNVTLASIFTKGPFWAN